MESDSNLSTHATAAAAPATDAGPVARLVALQGSAYQVAVRLVPEPADAEDVVQQAYLKVLTPAQMATLNALPADQLHPWFLRVVINLAKNHRRETVRRQYREATMETRGNTDEGEGVSPELAALLQRHLNALEETQRLPVVLHYEQGLTQKQVAELLAEPARTISDRIAQGLAQLRAQLAQAGYSAAPAVVIANLGASAPAAPAGLAGAVQALAQSLAGSAAAAGSSAGAATAAGSMASTATKAAVGGKLAVWLAAGLATVLAVGVGVHYYENRTPVNGGESTAAAGAPGEQAPADPPAAGAAEAPPAPEYVRPEVDPRLAANLERKVQLGAPRPQGYSEVIETLIRALPPYEELTVRVLPDWSPNVLPMHTSEIGRDLDQRLMRSLKLPAGPTTVRQVLDACGKQLDMEWQATGRTVVFRCKYSAADATRWFGAFADRQQAFAARNAAAQNIVEAAWPEGVAQLLKALTATDDADGAKIARRVLTDRRGMVCLADSGLAAAVRGCISAEEQTAIAGAEMTRLQADKDLCHSVFALQMWGFLHYPPAVPVLVRSLKECQDLGGLGRLLQKTGESPGDQRAAAATALGAIGGREAVDGLLAALAAEKDRMVSAAVIRALGASGDARAVEPLTGRLTADPQKVSEMVAAVEALGALGDAAAEPALVGLLADEMHNQYAISFFGSPLGVALARVHTATSGKTLQTLMQKAQATEVQRVAARTLVEFRDPATVPALLTALEFGDWQVGMSAGQALARIGDPGCFERLRQVAENSVDESVCSFAAQALMRAHDPGADRALLAAFKAARGDNRIWQLGQYLGAGQPPEALMAIVKTDKLPLRRRLAAAAYGQVGGVEAERALVTLQAVESDGEVRCGMLEGLAWSQRPATCALLKTLAREDPDEKIRQAAVGLVLNQAITDAGAVDVLIAALTKDASAAVRQAAMTALVALLEIDPARADCTQMVVLARGLVSRVGLPASVDEPAPGEPPTPAALPPADLTALQARAVAAIIGWFPQEAKAEVRNQALNALVSPMSGSRPGPTCDRLSAAYWAWLETDQDPEIQARLVQAFFMRMSSEPALEPKMVAILTDAKRDRKVRDAALFNLQAMHGKATTKTRLAMEQYQAEKVAKTKVPATSKASPTPAGDEEF